MHAFRHHVRVGSDCVPKLRNATRDSERDVSVRPERATEQVAITQKFESCGSMSRVGQTSRLGDLVLNGTLSVLVVLAVYCVSHYLARAW